MSWENQLKEWEDYCEKNDTGFIDKLTELMRTYIEEGVKKEFLYQVIEKQIEETINNELDKSYNQRDAER